MPRFTSPPATAPAAGSVTNAMLASPTAGVYTKLLHASGRSTTAALSAAIYLPVGISSDQTTVSVVGTTAPYVGLFYFDDADYAVAGLTPKFLVRAQNPIAGTSSTGYTITVGLYPVTISGGNFVLGTVVSGSTVLFSPSAINVVAQGNSGDFTVPADGVYTFGYVVSTTPSVAFAVHAQLYVRNV